LFIPCGRLSWLPVSFLLHVKYTLSYVVCRINTDPVLSVPNATGVPDVPTAPNVPNMTVNNPSVPKSYLVYQQNTVYQPVYQTSSVPK